MVFVEIFYQKKHITLEVKMPTKSATNKAPMLLQVSSILIAPNKLLPRNFFTNSSIRV